MSEHKIHIDLIEKYLDDNLDLEELQLFEQMLENDASFVRELNDMEQLISGIKKSASMTTLEDKLERFEYSIKVMEDDEEVSKSQSDFFNFQNIRNYSWAIAASITLILVSSITLFNINQTPSHQKLYAEYFIPFENHGNKRSIETTEKNYWKDALHYYDNGQYQLALDNFDKITITDYKGLVNHPRYSSYKIYKGNTLMKLGRHSEATTIFEGMLNDNDGLIIQAKWYLSMCYLYENKREKLIPLLEEIANLKKSSYGRDAQEVLSQFK